MGTPYYREIDGTPVPCDGVLEWGRWYGTADRKVARTQVGELSVSTVFLGIDHSFGEGDDPILYESMVFGPEGSPHAGEMIRYSTRAEAMAGHLALVAALSV